KTTRILFFSAFSCRPVCSQTIGRSLCIEDCRHRAAEDRQGDAHARSVNKSTWELAGALIGGGGARRGVFHRWFASGGAGTYPSPLTLQASVQSRGLTSSDAVEAIACSLFF